MGKHRLWKLAVAMLPVMLLSFSVFAQKHEISGKILDEEQMPIPGVNVVIKGTTLGTITGGDGSFSMQATDNDVLVITYIGYTTEEVTVRGAGPYNISLVPDMVGLEEVVVVGYGQQKKASVVGAIAQTTGATLQRAAGVTNIGAALTGNLPGVVTTATSGMPGDEEPKIFIRGQSSPNNSDPLVLVDGIERPMAFVDMASVETISVLKDASATAVYGVKGANGVILITTKRGQEGKAQINVSANAIMKMVSKLPGKYDSYDALMFRNMSLEHEMNITPEASWSSVNPQPFIDKFRNQTTVEQQERYPNIDWQDYLFKKYAMSYNANINIGGGTKVVRYFTSIDFVKEGDLFKEFDNGMGYDGGVGYYRVNFRSNLDFTITPTTIFKVNIAGSRGDQKTSRGRYGNLGDYELNQKWAGAYNTAPDAMYPRYSDGAWGYNSITKDLPNSVEKIALTGVTHTTSTRITTDFTIEQDLKFITEGLRFRAMLAWDNNFSQSGREIDGTDSYSQNPPRMKYINPYTGYVTEKDPTQGPNQFDYMQPVKWGVSGGGVNNGATQRNTTYQLQLNYGRQFGMNNVTAMGNFGRQEYNTGTGIPSYREDWVFRLTYDWNRRYFLEYNGAYNGSEKFSSENRFAFFNSGAVGWMVTEEPFMAFVKESGVLDMLKLRASYGEIGDDGGVKRFAYQSSWSYGGNVQISGDGTNSPYTQYKETSVGNPDIHWEVVRKFNFGIDYSLFKGLLAGSVEIFRDKRSDVFIAGNKRATPSYFGIDAAPANLGIIKNRGYEVELRVNKQFSRDMRLWANINFTHAENKVIDMDDPELKASYRKKAGYAIDQTITYVSEDFMQNYDDVYGSTKYDSKDNYKLPGDYYLVDFNGDGRIDLNDQIPWGFSSIPQNTYNATVGFEWKGFSCFAQFYGVSNVTRQVALNSFYKQYNNVYDNGTTWSEDHNNAKVITPRLFSSDDDFNNRINGTQFMYDGSYLRLKNAELAYTLKKVDIGKYTIKNVKLFINGNNLWVWTKMPDDRESNLAGNSGSDGQYPTVKRFNLGLKFSL